jgi:hypothetical protein
MELCTAITLVYGHNSISILSQRRRVLCRSPTALFPSSETATRSNTHAREVSLYVVGVTYMDTYTFAEVLVAQDKHATSCEAQGVRSRVSIQHYKGYRRANEYCSYHQILRPPYLQLSSFILTSPTPFEIILNAQKIVDFLILP